MSSAAGTRRTKLETQALAVNPAIRKAVLEQDATERKERRNLQLARARAVLAAKRRRKGHRAEMLAQLAQARAIRSQKAAKKRARREARAAAKAANGSPRAFRGSPRPVAGPQSPTEILKLVGHHPDRRTVPNVLKLPTVQEVMTNLKRLQRASKTARRSIIKGQMKDLAGSFTRAGTEMNLLILAEAQ